MKLILSIVLLAIPTFANLTVYCENLDDRNVLTYGGLAQYRLCEGLCDCYVFELLCLEPNVEYP